MGLIIEIKNSSYIHGHFMEGVPPKSEIAKFILIEWSELFETFTQTRNQCIRIFDPICDPGTDRQAMG